MNLTASELELLLKKLMPLGKVPQYDHTVPEIFLTDTSTRRFIFDSWFVRKIKKHPILIDSGKFNTKYIGFSFFESLSVLLQDNYDLYKKLFDFFEQIDQYASTITSVTSNAVIIFSHNLFGERLFPHIHLDDGQDSPTLSLFFNLTQVSTERPVLQLMDSLDHESKTFKKSYTDHRLLLVHERNSKNTDSIQIENNTGIIFNAFDIPHTFTYTDDLWVTVVYDHIDSKKLSKERYNVFPVKL